MSRAEIESKMSKESGITHQQAETALDSFIAYITDALKAGQKITLVGFGTFSVSESKARTSRNPRTGEPIQVPARKRAKFSAGSRLKEMLNS